MARINTVGQQEQVRVEYSWGALPKIYGGSGRVTLPAGLGESECEDRVLAAFGRKMRREYGKYGHPVLKPVGGGRWAGHVGAIRSDGVLTPGFEVQWLEWDEVV